MQGEELSWRTDATNFKNHYKAAVTKTRRYRHGRDKQGNGAESGARTQIPINTVNWLQTEERRPCDGPCLLNKQCWNNWTTACKKRHLDTDFPPFTEINSEWITDEKVKRTSGGHAMRCRLTRGVTMTTGEARRE